MQLRLRNFQAHALTEIDFPVGVNYITGKTNAGKSSVIRALCWLAFNRPAGGGKLYKRFKTVHPVSVGITFPDGMTVIRKRARVDSYLVTGGDDNQRYIAFKSDVPDEVKSVLQLAPVSIQRQADRHFLFSLGSGELTRMLNAMFGISVVDSSLTWIANEKRQLSAKVTAATAQIKSLKKSLSEFKDLTTLQAKYDVVKQQKPGCAVLEREVKALEAAIPMLTRASILLGTRKYAELTQAMMPTLSSSIKQVETRTVGVQTLGRVVDISQALLDDATFAQEQHDVIQQKLDKLGTVVCKTCGRPL